MAWSEFWSEIFTKVLQYGIVAILITLTVVIFMMLCAGCALSMEYLLDNHAQAKKKSREKNETTDIS